MDLGIAIATGNTADIYLHEGRIVKLFKDFLPENEAENEASIQKYTHSLGLPVPEVFDVAEINGRQALIMEYFAGKTIGDLLFEDMAKAKEYLSLSVDMQLKIHDISASGIIMMSDKLNRQLNSASALSERQRAALVEMLQNMRYECRLCHGDYHVFNLIMSESGVKIIDWVDASAGDIRSDACRSYLLYSLYSQELADLYLRLYCEKSGLHMDAILAWLPILAGAKLSENTDSKNKKRLH